MYLYSNKDGSTVYAEMNKEDDLFCAWCELDNERFSGVGITQNKAIEDLLTGLRINGYFYSTSKSNGDSEEE